MRLKLSTLIFTMFLFPVIVFGQSLNPVDQKAYDVLFNSTNGSNWTVSDLETLLKNKISPFIKKVNYNGSGKYRVTEISLNFNNLSGVIPEEFFYPYGVESNTYDKAVFYDKVSFAYNNITAIPENFFALYGKMIYVGRNDYSHNKISSFRANIHKHLSNLNGGMYTLDISFNNIKSLHSTDFHAGSSYKYSCMNYNIDTVNISNNYLNFSDVIDVKTYIEERIAKYTGTEANRRANKVIVAPQKTMGEVNTAITLNSGDSYEIEFSLPHADNIYQWELNGNEIQGANSKKLIIVGFNESKAGYYTCKITNPNVPELTLYSHPFPLLINGTKDIEDFDLSQKQVAPGLFSGAVVGTFSGELYYTLTDKRDNESFKIINGNTLITTERLFKYPEIKSYIIEVEALNIYGESVIKTFEIKENPDLAGINLIQSFKVDFKTIKENSETVVGTIKTMGYKNGNLAELSEYTLNLAAGKYDNNKFTLSGNKIVSTKLNYEEKSLYKLCVTAKHNSADIEFSTILSVRVENVNDKPYNLILTNNEINVNNKGGDIIGYLVAQDEDVADKQFVYELKKDSPGNKYVYLQDNIVKVNTGFTEATDFTIGCITKDPTGEVFQKDFSILVKESTPNAKPTAVGLSNLILQESWTDGAEVAILFMKDIDAGLGTFSLAEGGDNDYFRVNGQVLEVAKELKGHGNKFTISVTATDDHDESVTASLNLYIPSECNGTDIIEINSGTESVAVYPNPFNSTISVKTDNLAYGNYIVNVYDLSGNIVHRSVIDDVRDGLDQQMINLDSLGGGAYILHLTNEKTTYAVQIIKQ